MKKTNKQYNKHNSAFTIVELLIVIVVIAILAAITVVAYNGIQTSARNATQVSAANGYIKLLTMYKTEHDFYPTNYGCLGSNNIDTNGDGIKDCGDNGNVAVSQALLDSLSLYGTLPDVATKQIVGTSGVKRSGMRYYLSGTDPAIAYFIEGSSAQCISGATRGSDGNAIWCVYKLP